MKLTMERQSCLFIVMVGVILVMCPQGSSSYVPSPLDFLSVTVLNSKALLMEFLKDPALRAVYYFKRDLPRLRAFLKELDKSAENLKVYSVEIALFDCTSSAAEDEETCKEEKVEQMIYTYRNGQKLLQLELETMFNINSIMSNILQLVLLREVPILQRPDERNQYVDRHRGKFDTIFGYMRAIGTYEHRVFMEVAYAYQDKFKFALCTNKEGYNGLEGENEVGEQSTAWVIYSKGSTEIKMSCPSLRLKCTLNLVNLASFVKALTLPKMYDVPVSGTEIPYQSKDMHIAYLYYDSSTEKTVKENAAKLAQDFHGTVGTVTVERNAALQQFASHGYDGHTPRIGFQKKDAISPVFPPPELWNPQELTMFVKASVSEYCRNNQDEMTRGETEERGTAVSPDVNVDEVESQDDEVAEEVTRLTNVPMKLDLVPALTDKTFPQNIGSTNLLLVLFYLPFDAKSMSFLRRYGEASVMLGGGTQPIKSLARLNCFDWTDVCASQNVTIYPTLRIYQKMGAVHEDYKGPMDTQAVYSTAKLLQYSRPLPLTEQSQIDGFVSGFFPSDLSTMTNTSILALFGKSHDQEQAVYNVLAEEMKDKFVFGLVDNALAPKIADMYGTALPAVVILKRDDLLEPHVVYRGTYQKIQALKDFILMNSLPKLVELTPQHFPQLYGQKKPFVVLFTNGGDESKLSEKALVQVIQMNKYTDLIYCYLSVPSSNSLGHRVLQQYTSNLVIPTISLVKLNTGEVFNLLDGYKYDSDKVSEWIGRVLAGQEQASSMLPRGDWKPLSKGYDFLKFIEWEKKHVTKKGTSQLLATAEEHGIGFNANGEYEGKEERGTMQEDEVGKNMMMETTNKQDAEVREELLQLHSSRLYPHKRVKDHSREGKMDKMKTDGKLEPQDKVKHEEL